MTEKSRNALSGLSDQDRAHVWRILHEECGAAEEPMGDWIHWPECREYRFSGALGFGGKVWFSRVYPGEARQHPVYVTFYNEDKTPERQRMMEDANARFAGELSHLGGVSA